MREFINGPAAIKGRVRFHRVPNDVVCGHYYGTDHDSGLPQIRLGRPCFMRPWASRPVTDWDHNDIMYDWAAIVSRLLADGGSQYRIGGMYLEYKNVADPDDVVTPPAFGREDGIAYYNGLAGSADTDFLRVPLIAAVRSSSNEALFPDGNRITFFARTQGVVGVHGKAFSDSVNSKLYGAALVAIPDQADRTKDLVLSRMYVATAKQQVKLPTSEIGPEWEITLG